MQTEATIEANGDGCWFCDAVERTEMQRHSAAHRFFAENAVSEREAATDAASYLAQSALPADRYFWSEPAARSWKRIVEYAAIYLAMVIVPLSIIVPLIGNEAALALGQVALAIVAVGWSAHWLSARWQRWRAPILNDMRAALAYVRPHFVNAATERAVIVGIGADHGLVFEHVIKGNRHSVDIDMRDLLASALRADAIILLLFHNHPDESVARPSRQDDRFTNRLIRSCRDVGMMAIDHVVIAGDDACSYLLNGSMKQR